MSLWRKAAKRDTAEAPIVAALEAAGVKVWRLSQPFDLLCGLRGRFVVLECKTGNRKPDKRQVQQNADLADCHRKGLPVYVVRTPEEALQAIGAKH